MATNYRNSAGVDFDDLFDPYVQGTIPSSTNYRTSDGVDLAGRYAPLSYGSKAPDVNYRTSAGTDVTNLWAAKGTAQYSLPFHGQTYSADATAPTGATGTTSATVTLSINSDGTWQITRSISGSATGNGTTVLGSGTWLPSGASAGNYEVQFAGSGSGGTTVTNGASSYSALSSTRSIQLNASVVSSTTSYVIGSASITCNLRPIGGNASTSVCTFEASALGQV